MARRTLSLTAVITTVAALLLTACGGSDDSSSGDIKGADTASRTPSASASVPGGGAKRPEVTIPKSFTLDFKTWTSGDPVEQAVLNDGKQRYRATIAAIIAGDPKADYLAFYNVGGALSTGQAYVKGYSDKNLTLIGKATVSDPKVTLLDKERATLIYCVDEGQGYTKDRKTGAEEGTPKDVNPHVQYVTGLRLDPDGIWKTADVRTQRGRC